MILFIKQLMKYNDAPPEHYERIGLDRNRD